MARYYSKQTLLDMKDKDMNCVYDLTDLEEYLAGVPAADVVPRAMIAEIFAEIEKRIASLEYRANTPRKTVKVEELKAQCDWILHEVIPKTLAELKKKYTEGEK